MRRASSGGRGYARISSTTAYGVLGTEYQVRFAGAVPLAPIAARGARRIRRTPYLVPGIPYCVLSAIPCYRRPSPRAAGVRAKGNDPTYFPAVGTVAADSAAAVAGTTSIAPYLCSTPHRRRASRAS